MGCEFNSKCCCLKTSPAKLKTMACITPSAPAFTSWWQPWNILKNIHKTEINIKFFKYTQNVLRILKWSNLSMYKNLTFKHTFNKLSMLLLCQQICLSQLTSPINLYKNSYIFMESEYPQWDQPVNFFWSWQRFP